MTTPNERDVVRVTDVCSGLLLSDLFAAAALAGMLASDEWYRQGASLARHAYAFADAMLAERARKEQQ